MSLTRTTSVAVLAYAVAVYVFFLAVLGYAMGFFANVGVPTGLDGEPRVGAWTAVAVDLLLLALFAGQHTVMARPWFKRRWTRIVPEPAERATFVLAASLTLAFLYGLWQPIGGTVWDLSGAPAAAVTVGYAVGWAVAVGATFVISHSDLFGLRQARLAGRYVPPPFVERGPYRLVRQPMMIGFLVVFWATPRMTVGHLLFAAAATAYILVGVAFEEHDLLRSLGAPYAAYRARVPAFLPRRRPRPDPVELTTPRRRVGGR